jgi:hypothetical protein
MKLTGENRSTWGENLSQCHFVQHQSHMDWPRIDPGAPRWEAGEAARIDLHNSLSGREWYEFNHLKPNGYYMYRQV